MDTTQAKQPEKCIVALAWQEFEPVVLRLTNVYGARDLDRVIPIL
jgi:hypothetical protein